MASFSRYWNRQALVFKEFYSLIAGALISCGSGDDGPAQVPPLPVQVVDAVRRLESVNLYSLVLQSRYK